MAENNELLTGFMMGQNDRNGGGFFGGEGIWGFLILAMIFGWGGGGWGGGGAMLQGMATRADISEGFALNNITGGIRGLEQGLCNGFHDITVTTMQGFSGVERGFSSLSHQLSDCCCENRAAIAQVRYDMANQTRDVIEAGNANTRAILDFLTQDKISSLQQENQALRFSASQDRQNAYITTAMQAQTNQLIERIAPYPVPSYSVPAPYPYCGSGAYAYGGYGNWGGNGCGCGLAA